MKNGAEIDKMPGRPNNGPLSPAERVAFRDLEIALNRRVAVEEVLNAVAIGKRNLLTREECRELAAKLGVQPAPVAPVPVTITPDGFSVTLKPTRTGFKHPHDEGKMLRLWIGQTNRGQSMSMLSYGFYCSGSFEGMDYTPVDASELAEVPRDISERIDAVNVLASRRQALLGSKE